MANNCTPNVQAKISDIHRLGMAQPAVGALAMAYSPQNGAEVQAKMIQRNGKSSQYSITYPSAQCGAIVTCDDAPCTDTATNDSTLTSCETFTSFSCASSEWYKLAISGLRDLGSLEVRDVFATKVFGQMQKIKDYIDTAYVVQLCADAGYATASEANPTRKLIDANGAPIFTTDADILADFGDAGWSGVSPLLLGGRMVSKYMKGIMNGGLNNSGVNIGSIERFAAFYDKNVVEANCAAPISGHEVMFAVLPGVANVLTWSENAGMFASRNNPQRWDSVDPTSLIQEGATFSHTVIEDPATGMLFDLNLIYEPKCKAWEYQVKCYYKFLNLPLVGCKDANFNGIVKYDVCPDTSVVCN